MIVNIIVSGEIIVLQPPPLYTHVIKIILWSSQGQLNICIAVVVVIFFFFYDLPYCSRISTKTTTRYNSYLVLYTRSV